MDIHFRKFLTPKLATVAWVATLVVAALIVLVGFIVGVHSPVLFLGWILTVIVVGFWVLGTRLFLEFIVVQFKQAEHLSVISAATDYQAKVTAAKVNNPDNKDEAETPKDNS
jgi:hypothetical protein